jgi:hypothetical protein
MVEHQQFTRDNRGGDRTIGVLRQGKPPFPLLISIQVVANEPIRPEVDIDSLSVCDRRRAGGTADLVNLFDLSRRNSAAPEDLAGVPIDAERG